MPISLSTVQIYIGITQMVVFNALHRQNLKFVLMSEEKSV